MRMSDDLVIFERLKSTNMIGIYNAFTHTFSIVHGEIYNYLKQKSKKNSLSDIYDDLTREQIGTLLEHGILVADEEAYLLRKYRASQIERIKRIDTAYLHLTLKCNLTCEYCYNSDLINKPGTELSISQWNKAIELLRSVGARKVILTGGEPFIFTGLFSVADFAKSLGLHVTLLTNGTLLDTVPGIFDVIDKCIISLDGASASKRKGLDQENVLRNVIRIAKSYPGKLNVRSVVVRNLENEVLKLRTVLQSHNIKHMQTICIPNNLQDVELIPDYDRFSLYDKEFISSGRCSAGDGIVALNACGDIFPCQTMIKSDFLIANIFDADWIDKYNSNRACDEIGAFQTCDITVCDSCYAKHFCNGGCRAIAYSVYGDISHRNDFFCDYYRKCAIHSIRCKLEAEVV